MKLFFREMPNPLLTKDLYEPFITAQQISDLHLRKRCLRALVHKMPKVNIAVLRYLMSFLAKVDKYSSANKMTIFNLSTVFAPNLIKSNNEDVFSLVHDTPAINGLVYSLFLYYDYIFTDFLIAEAIYDYETQDPKELTIKKGDKIKIKEEGEPNGWWWGVITSSDGTEKKGMFPGSYITLVFPSESGKYIKDLQLLKDQLVLSVKLVEDFKTSKKILQQDIKRLKSLHSEKKPNQEFHDELPKLKEFKENLEYFYTQLENSFKTRAQSSQSKNSLIQSLQHLKKNIYTDPKFKKYRGAKLGDMLELLLEYIQSEDKYHLTVDERKEQLLKSLTQLRGLLKKNIEEK